MARPAPVLAPQASADITQAPLPRPRVERYTLPPQTYRKAVEYARIRYRFYFLRFGYALLLAWLLLCWRVAARFRNWAERLSRWRWAQAGVVTLLVYLTLDALRLPFRVYGQMLSRRYGISVQGWASWFQDLAKSEVSNVIFAVILVWLAFGMMRRSPRRWWLGFWLAAIPLTFFLVYIVPVAVDPMFYRFEPLAARHPQLTAKIEQVAKRGGLRIPPERIFEMNASAKLNAVNAYVTGIGPSKRVVVWDTTLAKMNEAEALSVFGHEMGHYVLGHVLEGLIASLAGLFVGLYALARLYRAAMAHWGGRWALRSTDDYAALPLLLLLIWLLTFAAMPIENAYSRHLEHQADLYGLEVLHGAVPDAGQVTASSLQIMGELDLEDPAPPALIRFWLYTHPPVADRIRFALTYHPWSNGESPRYVR